MKFSFSFFSASSSSPYVFFSLSFFSFSSSSYTSFFPLSSSSFSSYFCSSSLAPCSPCSSSSSSSGQTFVRGTTGYLLPRPQRALCKTVFLHWHHNREGQKHYRILTEYLLNSSPVNKVPRLKGYYVKNMFSGILFQVKFSCFFILHFKNMEYLLLKRDCNMFSKSATSLKTPEYYINCIGFQKIY